MTPRALTYDAGELIALDRNDQEAWGRLKAAIAAGVRPVVPAPVVAQVWRSGRQANLGRALAHLRVEHTDDALAQEAGGLCGKAASSDVVDAIVVASAARRHSAVLTSDPVDLAALAVHTSGVSLITV